jgi:hypothetical protein
MMGRYTPFDSQKVAQAVPGEPCGVVDLTLTETGILLWFLGLDRTWRANSMAPRDLPAEEFEAFHDGMKSLHIKLAALNKDLRKEQLLRWAKKGEQGSIPMQVENDGRNRKGVLGIGLTTFAIGVGVPVLAALWFIISRMST